MSESFSFTLKNLSSTGVSGLLATTMVAVQEYHIRPSTPCLIISLVDLITFISVAALSQRAAQPFTYSIHTSRFLQMLLLKKKKQKKKKDFHLLGIHS